MCNIIKRLFLVVSFIPVQLFSGTFSDSYIGYSVNLPQNWVRSVDRVNQHVFFDASGNYKSIIVIAMTDFSSDLSYTTPSAWIRAHFIAYLTNVRSTKNQFNVPHSDPYGSILFYDTTSSIQCGLRSMEIYTEFRTLNSDEVIWDEYVKYVEVNKKGYEIYLLGYSADIDPNMLFYIEDIVKSIIIAAPSP
ncbi:MAG: hypothetical protein JXB49_34770 [Bacteroidales bacterium]|nr:hypothetical protein [Bacteroidales bacterium]